MNKLQILKGAIIFLLLGQVSTDAPSNICTTYDCLDDAICPPDSSIDDDYYDDTIIVDDLVEDIKDYERHIPRRFQRSVDNLFAQCCNIDKICKCNTCKFPVCSNSTHVPIRTRIASHSPGDCCDKYQCQKEPNCSEDPKALWRTECKDCRCTFGETLCTMIENCEVHKVGCYSNDLRKSFQHEEQWREAENCKVCSCLDGDTKCTQIDCKLLDCENPIKVAGQCCKICPGKEEIPSIQNATSEGPLGCFSSTFHKFFEHGEEWKEAEDCMECRCIHGDIRCESSYCKGLDCEVQVKLPGQCCKICDDGITTTQPPAPEDDNIFLQYYNIMYIYGIVLLCIILVTVSFCFFCRRHHHEIGNYVSNVANCVCCCRNQQQQHHHHHHHRVSNFVATSRDNKYSSIQQSESTITTAPSTPTLK